MSGLIKLFRTLICGRNVEMEELNCGYKCFSFQNCVVSIAKLLHTLFQKSDSWLFLKLLSFDYLGVIWLIILKSEPKKCAVWICSSFEKCSKFWRLSLIISKLQKCDKLRKKLSYLYPHVKLLKFCSKMVDWESFGWFHIFLMGYL